MKIYIKKHSRNASLNLYNPKKEGVGLYDINYINACKKVNMANIKLYTDSKERELA
tara:strand:- start:673 stop:840 length:168 start_codon:yes stop_codon:yes gene_type:complete